MNRLCACGVIMLLAAFEVAARPLSGISPDSAGVSFASAADTSGLRFAALSSPAPDTSSHTPVSRFFTTLGRDLRAQAAAPFGMNGKQAAYAAAGVTITLGLVALDETIDRRVRGIRTDVPWIGKASHALTDFGGPYGVLSAAAYTGYSVIWADDDAQQTSVLLAHALITSGLWTRAAKLMAGRERPSAAYEHSHLPGGLWHGPAGPFSKLRGLTMPTYDAFPSGHTATAFALATVLARRYSESSYVPAVSYSIATLIGVTRMIEHTHWASDVFAGACIGYLCADQVVTSFEEEQLAAQSGAAEPVRTKVRLSVGMLDQSPALRLAVSF